MITPPKHSTIEISCVIAVMAMIVSIVLPVLGVILALGAWATLLVGVLKKNF